MGVGNAYRLDPDDPDYVFQDNYNVSRPWKKVALAIGLFLTGSVLLATGLGLYLSGAPDSHGIPLMVLGSLVFLPGFYHTLIAYKAWRGQAGYSLNQIPDF